MLKPKKILQNIPVYPVDEYREDWFLKLDSNENIFGPSPRVLECFKNLECRNFNFYPCYGELLDELSKLHGVEKENILLTNGCDEAISVVLNAYLEQGDVVASFTPTFVMPKIYTKALGGVFCEIDYDTKWRFDADKLIEGAKGAKVILITSPNSPTGETVKREDIVKVLEACPDSLVLLDNTYINYSKKPLYAELLGEYSNLFIVKSFSKDFALAGLRLGYVIGQGVFELRKIISPYSVNSLAVLAGLESLKDTTHFEAVKKEVLASKELLSKGLFELGFVPYESDGNFLLCDFGDKAEFLYRKLLSKKIRVKNFSKTKGLEGCFRITVPSVRDTETFLKTLAPKELLVFDLDGVVFDVRDSYRVAIEKTFEHFTGKKVAQGEIQAAKNAGGLNCDWDLTKHLLDNAGVNIPLEEVTRVFQELFFNDGKGGLIDNEKLLLDPKLLGELHFEYDFAVFTGRPLDETLYSLKRFGLEKYFSYIVTKYDLPEDEQKPSPCGLELIKKACTYKNITYFGDTSDDMKSAKAANVRAVGVLPPQDKSSELQSALKSFGACEVVEDINVVLEGKVCV